MANKIPGATLTATVTTATTGTEAGLVEYMMTQSYDTLINLSNTNDPNNPNASGLGVYVNAVGSGNDKVLLGTSSGNIINLSGPGNDEVVLAPSAVDLNGNVILASGGFNDILMDGVGQTVDLTKVTYGTAATGIDAVIGAKAGSGQTVDLTLNQVASSTLTGGVKSSANRAFVSMIGTDGTVNIAVPNSVKFLGVLNSAGQGFDANGAPLSTADTQALAGEVTSIGNVAGTIARSYTGAATVKAETAALLNLSAYVFSSAGVDYTVWTDGTITTTDNLGNANTYAQAPAGATLLPYGLGTIQNYDSSLSHSSAVISTVSASAVINPSSTQLTLSDGTIPAFDSITVGAVSGTVVQGNSATNGGDYFNLAASLGGNEIIGSTASSVFDVGTSGALSDILVGGGGAAAFNVVTSTGAGEIDLTANNGVTATAAKNVRAVVGSASVAQTVDVDLSTLLLTSVTQSYFEAFIGSGSTLNVEASKGTWQLAETDAPGVTPTTAHTTPLANADLLNTLFGATKTDNAGNALSAYVFQEIVGTGVHARVAETVTIYTDATVSNSTTAPALLAQSMASFAPAGGSATLTPTPTRLSQAPLLAAAQA
jgi:hypothetical protein